MAPASARDLGSSMQPLAGEQAQAAEEGHASAEGEGGGGGGMRDILDPPWVNRYFFLDVLAVTILGCAMGALAYPYSVVVDKVAETWLEHFGKEGFVSKPENVQFCAGSPWWILICWVCFTAVGVLKVCIGLDTYPSFIEELKHQHVDPWVSTKVVISCIASLCAGAALGLEAGLGAIGAALGYVLAQSVNGVMDSGHDLRRRTYILSGMAGAFGSILPAPFVAVILVSEIASAGTERLASEEDFMAGRKLPKKVLIFLVPAATAAFVIKYAIEPSHQIQHPWAELPYDNMSVFYGLGLGFVAAVVGLVFVLLGALIKLMFVPVQRFSERLVGKAFRQVVMASLGGVLTGVGIYMFPLTTGSGKSGMAPAILYFQRKELGLEALIGTAFMKCAVYWTSAHAGMVGGIFYPLLFIGEVSGLVCAEVFNIPLETAVPIMLGAVPATILSAPLTLLSFPVGMFVTGPVQTVPIVVAIVTTNTLMVGTGFMEKLMGRQAK